ncbi:MAG: amino acid ABC transporter permease [Granulosicoccus sp.]
MIDRMLSELPSFFGYYNVIFLLKAAGVTIALSVIGCVFGGVLGGMLAILRLTDQKLLAPARWVAIAFIEFFRRVPFLVTLMLTFFVFQFSGLNVSTFTVGAVTVLLIAAAFLAEIIRGGLQSVHRNQWDAALTMNFSLFQTVRHVVLPQAWRVILPPAFSFFLLFIKDTALASQISVVELTYAGKVLNTRGFSAPLVFGTILLMYFAISYPLARYGARLEKRLAPSGNRQYQG